VRRKLRSGRDTVPPGGRTGDSRQARISAAAKLGLAIQFAPQGSHAEQSETQQRHCRSAIGNMASSGLGNAIRVNRLDERKHGSYGQDE